MNHCIKFEHMLDHIVTLIEILPNNHQKLNKSNEQLLSMSSSIYKACTKGEKVIYSVSKWTLI